MQILGARTLGLITVEKKVENGREIKKNYISFFSGMALLEKFASVCGIIFTHNLSEKRHILKGVKTHQY